MKLQAVRSRKHDVIQLWVCYFFLSLSALLEGCFWLGVGVGGGVNSPSENSVAELLSPVIKTGNDYHVHIYNL